MITVHVNRRTLKRAERLERLWAKKGSDAIAFTKPWPTKKRVKKISTGESHINAKFSWDDIREMRRLREEEDRSLPYIAKQFNTSPSNVHSIVNYRTWKEDPK